MEEPLLQGKHKPLVKSSRIAFDRVSDSVGNGSESVRSYQYLQRSGSVIHPPSPDGAPLSAAEIRSAASAPLFHPPSIDSSIPQSLKPVVSLINSSPLGSDYKVGEYGGYANEYSRQSLDEVEIRELLIDHVGHRCCWGNRPARTWKIQAIEDCNVYVGTLETFVEHREIEIQTEPYLGNKINAKGSEINVWDLDLRSHFPLLFTQHKETRINVPDSESLKKCSDCNGRGEIICLTCNKDQEPGFYKENQTQQCSSCHGRGLIAHRDGSDTTCQPCNGKGTIPCANCGSRGLLKCHTCHGSGSILERRVAVVRWETLPTRKVSASSGAASVPEDVFHRAKGVQLCNNQAYLCTPTYFADSYFLNKFSSEVIADRAAVPANARVICERHIISVVPVTRVSMSNGGRSFSFYIIGFAKQVYLKDYYPSTFCWGICPCLDFLKL